MNLFRKQLAVFASLLLMTTSLVYAYGIETREVQFAKGKSSAIIRSTIKGDQTIDYTLRARAGQTMSVTLATRNGSNYFNVLPPGSNDEALFVGSSDGNKWTAALPADGEYKLRVYLMRNAARRNEVANYALTVAITGAPRQSVWAALGQRCQGQRHALPRHWPAALSHGQQQTY